MSLNGSLALINQALDINASSAGSASKLVTPIGWQVKDDGSGNLGFYNPSGQEEMFITPGGLLSWADGNTWQIGPTGSDHLGFYSGASDVIVFREGGDILMNGQLFVGSSIAEVEGISTVGNTGVPAEYSSTQSSPVPITNSSTLIGTYTPTFEGLYLVVICIMSTTSATLSTLAVTYTDISSASAATQTPATAVAIASGSANTYLALCPATTAAAITVHATASIGTTDLHGSVVVFAL